MEKCYECNNVLIGRLKYYLNFNRICVNCKNDLRNFIDSEEIKLLK